MNISILQTETLWCDPEGNRKLIEDNIRSMIKAGNSPDIIFLPEMFTTGFITDPSHFPEADNSTISWMQALCDELNIAICGSVMILDSGKYYNRMYFVSADSKCISYDKRHLFSYAGEEKHYARGHLRVVATYRNARILLQICYDLRFPVFSRYNDDYDMIIYSANWPTERIEHWNTLLRARAIENQCYVAGVNRTGKDPFNTYAGNSAIIDFTGKPLVELGNLTEYACASIDLQKQKSYRNDFPALRERDRFLFL